MRKYLTTYNVGHLRQVFAFFLFGKSIKIFNKSPVSQEIKTPGNKTPQAQFSGKLGVPSLILPVN